MAKITIACAALSGRIYAGKFNKAGTAFLNGKEDVTSDVLKAVIDKIKPGFVETVTVDGAPKYEIEVREVKITIIRGDHISKTGHHDAGAFARCSYCGRYSDKPNALFKDDYPCDCGKLHGWSGSFKKPTADSIWSEA